jgi:hypothetical protein
VANISFSAAEFIVKLRDGQFASPPLTATGLVKVSEDEANTLLFAHGTDCTNWVEVPVQMIDSVEFLRVVPCKDHTHPLVTLVFAVPKSPEAQTFAAIAKSASAASFHPQTPSALQVLGVPVQTHPLQPHAFMAALKETNTVAPDPNGHCPDGYFPCHLGLGCCPGFLR